MQLITTEGKGAPAHARHVLRGCGQFPLLGMLQQVTTHPLSGYTCPPVPQQASAAHVPHYAIGSQAPSVLYMLHFKFEFGSCGVQTQVALRRPAAAKGSKFSGTAYVVADSTIKDPEAATALLRASGGAAELDTCGRSTTLPAGTDLEQATVNGGYAGLNGALTHVNGGNRTPKGPQRTAFEPGKVWPVPDHSVLNLPAPKAGPGLAPRSYEALQLFDSAPRGLSLAQPS